MFHKTLVAMTLTSALCFGTAAIAAPANTTAPPPWQNTVHPIPPGTHTESSPNTATHASTSASAPAWHNTVHPIPPGSRQASTSGNHPYRTRK